MAMELRGDVSDLRRWQLAHLLNDEASGYADYEQRINATLAAVKAHREAYEKLISSPEEKALVTAFDQSWTAFLADNSKMLSLSAAGSKDEARALSRNSAKALTDLTDATTKLVKLNIDGGDAASDTATATYNTARATSIALLVINIGIGLALAVAVARIVSAPLREAVSVASAVAEGDLTRDIQVKSACETGQLMQALKNMTDNLQALVAQVRSGTDLIATASAEIASGNQDLSSRTEEQASSLEETASSMEELTSTVKQNADNARQANQLAKSASGIATRGGEVVGQVVGTMASINESSRKIEDIISVIDGIAFQTNILALNAAVEAARAGEQGRGFAVVAGEVRNLAHRSAAAAKDIKQLIGDSVQKVEAGSQLVNEAGTTMNEIVSSITRVTDIMAEISSASNEQSDGIEQVNTAITQMDTVTQQNAALVEESAAAAESMQSQAAQLSDIVSVFKIHPSATRPAVAAPAVKRAVAAPAPAPARIAATSTASAKPAPKKTARQTRPVRHFHQQIGRVVLARHQHCHPDADGQDAERRLLVRQLPARQFGAQFLRRAQGVGGIGGGCQQRKFLAAVAGHDVGGAAAVGGDQVGHGAQRGVAGLVAVMVVIFFKVIDVEHRQRQRLAGARGAPPFGRQRQVEAAPVAHARQAVGGAERGQLAVRFFQLGRARRHQLFQLQLLARQAVDADFIEQRQRAHHQRRAQHAEPPALPERRRDGDVQRGRFLVPHPQVVGGLDAKHVVAGIEVGVAGAAVRRVRFHPLAVEPLQLVGVAVLGRVGVVQGSELQRKHRRFRRQRERGGRRDGALGLDVFARLAVLQRVVEHGDVGDRHLRRHRNRPHCRWCDGGHAVHAAEVQHAVGRARRRVDGEALGQAVGSRKQAGLARLGIEAEQADNGTAPDLAVEVVLDGEDFLRAHGRRIRLEARRAVGLEFDQVDALAGAHPDPALGVLVQADDVVVADAGRVGVIVVEVAELAADGIEPVQAAAIPFRAHPHAAAAVLQHGRGAVDAAAADVLRVVVINRAGVGLRVVADQAIAGGQPQHAVGAGRDGVDVVAGGIAEVDGLERAVGRIEPVQAVGGLDDGVAVGVVQAHAHVAAEPEAPARRPRQAQQRIAGRRRAPVDAERHVAGKAFAVEVSQRNAVRERGDPQHAAAVLHHRAQIVAGQAVRVVGRMDELVERAARRVPAQQSGRQRGAPQHALAVDIEIGDAAGRRGHGLARGPVAKAVPAHHARFGADPQRALAVELQRAHDVDAGIGPGRGIDLVVGKRGGAGRQVVESARPGGNPHAAPGVHRQCVEVVAGQAGGVLVVVNVHGELAGVGRVVLQAAPAADPHAALAVGNNGFDDAVVFRPVGGRHHREIIGLGIEARQAVLGAGPDAALRVFVDGGHAVVRQAGRIGRVVGVLDGLVTVVAVQAVGMGAYPDIALAVLHQRQHRRLVAAQRAQFLEAQRRRGCTAHGVGGGGPGGQQQGQRQQQRVQQRSEKARRRRVGRGHHGVSEGVTGLRSAGLIRPAGPDSWLAGYYTCH
uniref:Chemoreceptor McpA-like n=1 Tax=Tanacetum cinerariifolium TaxID=118510 RepID=A0A699GFE5_TANCI|nr:chemoreceptor McpA-like [Tanacetum cinerariifolium]